MNGVASTVQEVIVRRAKVSMVQEVIIMAFQRFRTSLVAFTSQDLEAFCPPRRYAGVDSFANEVFLHDD